MFALLGLAHAATVGTFPTNPSFTSGPFSGLEALVVDPAVTAAELVPDEAPMPSSVQRVRSEARPPDTALVFTNPTSTWAWLSVNQHRIGTVAPFATVRLEGLAPGRYRVDLLLPNGFTRAFEVVTHIPAVDLPATLAPVAASLVGERVELSERLYFETDAAALHAVSRPWLDAVAALLLARPDILVLRVEAYADAEPEPAAEPGYDLALAEARAGAVRAYLLARGVAPERVVAVGLGGTPRVAAGETEAAFAANRRVDLVVAERAPEPVTAPAP